MRHGAVVKEVVMKWDHRGCTRSCLIIGAWAIKTPSWQSDWNHYLMGMLGIDREVRLSRHDDRFCPVLWSAPLGLVAIMPRARILEEFSDQERELASEICDKWPTVEFKPNSFGYLASGQFVCVDYG